MSLRDAKPVAWGRDSRDSAAHEVSHTNTNLTRSVLGTTFGEKMAKTVLILYSYAQAATEKPTRQKTLNVAFSGQGLSCLSLDLK
jgi:predicted KAP-like P-loop ATPase